MSPNLKKGKSFLKTQKILLCHPNKTLFFSLICVVNAKERSLVYRFEELDEFWLATDVKRSKNVLVFSMNNQFLLKSSIMIFTWTRKVS